jgi:diguanylate cyclase (GGDEF)-like protein
MAQKVEEDISVGAIFARSLRNLLALVQTEDQVSVPPPEQILDDDSEVGHAGVLFRALQLSVLPEVFGTTSGPLLYLAAKRFSLNLNLKSLQALKAWFHAMELGELEIELDDEKILVKLSHCLTCYRLPNTGAALCDFERGLIDGVLENVTGAEVLSKETLCWGLGDTVCQFEAYADGHGGYVYQEQGLHSEFQERLLTGIADQAELAVENLKLVRARRSMETRDELTGLYNFRHLREHAVLELARATRYSRQVTFVMIDLDDFSEVNMVAGRAVGDEVLQQWADALREQVRGCDLVCRYGADEFLLVLPETAEGQADSALQRVLGTLQEVGLKVGELTFTLTACAGVAVFPQDGQRVEELVAKAATTMYAVKASGKGSVGFYGSATR